MGSHDVTVLLPRLAGHQQGPQTRSMRSCTGSAHKSSRALSRALSRPCSSPALCWGYGKGVRRKPWARWKWEPHTRPGAGFRVIGVQGHGWAAGGAPQGQDPGGGRRLSWRRRHGPLQGPVMSRQRYFTSQTEITRCNRA